MAAIEGAGETVDGAKNVTGMRDDNPVVILFGRPVIVIRSGLVVSPGVREGKADAPFSYVAETVSDAPLSVPVAARVK